MIKAVIFDMYGTLFAMSKVRPYTHTNMARDMGISPDTFEDMWSDFRDSMLLGKISFEETVCEMMKANDSYTDARFDKVMKKMNSYKSRCFSKIDAEILPLFNTLKELGYKIGLICNCSNEDVIPIRECRLYSYFDEVMLSCEVGLKKPDIHIYNKMIQKLGVTPTETIYVGDGSNFELIGARDAGIFPLQARWHLKANENIEEPEIRTITHPLSVLNFLSM